jgi:signal transduction histidine kinase
MHDDARRSPQSLSLYLGLVAIAIAMLYFGTRMYRAVETDLSTAAVSGRSAVSTLAASTLRQDFQRWVDIGRALASRVRFAELVALGRWQEAIQIMAAVPRDFAPAEAVLLADMQGNLQAAMPGGIGGSVSDRDWYRAVATRATAFVSDVQHDEAGRAVFHIAVPVFDQSGELRAVLALRVGTRHFANLFTQLNLERSGSLQVIDRNGISAFESAAANDTQPHDRSQSPAVQRAVRGESGVSVDPADVDAKQRFVSAYAPSTFGWGVIAQWPYATVFGARDDELRRLTVATALLAAMTVIAVFLLVQLALQRRQTDSERRANAQLESRVQERTVQLKNMNQELESFSYSISHDLRAPLRAIDGYTALLRETGSAIPEASRLIDNVHRNVVHMTHLIDELLELSRVGRVALDRRQIDMQAMAQEALAGIATNAAQIEIAALPFAQGDSILIRQIWINLLDNAVKYSSQAAAPRVAVTGQLQGDDAVYCIADNGIGFDMQHYNRLFKPFSRLHGNEYAGTGVGLAIVKTIVERHGGRIWAESVPGAGTRVFFALPRRALPTESVPAFPELIAP